MPLASRFSLRTLLLLVAVAAVVLALWRLRSAPEPRGPQVTLPLGTYVFVKTRETDQIGSREQRIQYHGTITRIDDEWLVLARDSKLQWIPREAILMVEMNQPRK